MLKEVAVAGAVVVVEEETNSVSGNDLILFNGKERRYNSKS